MRRRTRPRTLGFTIAEVLVSIAILAVALTGVLAALAYDAFAAEQAGNYTYALNYSRKIMDLLQSGQIDPLVYAQNVGSESGIPAVTSNQGNDGTNWHNLDGGLNNILNTGNQLNNDFWGLPGSGERKRFDVEKLKYGVNFCYFRERTTPGAAAAAAGSDDVNNGFKNLLVNLVVTTRWRVRRGFRSIRLRSFYVTTAS
jgi:prepilin-type N-terminal cleavage/methylation domain-containing protein